MSATSGTAANLRENLGNELPSKVMANVEYKSIFEAVATIYSPISSAEARRDAHQYLESLQTACAGSSKLAEIGFDLALEPGNSTEIRHCGLQFIENCVKFSWYNVSDENRRLIIIGCFEKLAVSTLIESNPGKDGVSRIIVEIAKREWPQHWPGFLSECEKLCNFQEPQRLLALLILLRLVEDVAVFQNIGNVQRRRELYNALVQVSSDLLKLATSILREHSSKLVNLSDHDAAVHVALCRHALLFISSLMDWVPAKDLLALKSDFIPLLYQLLTISDASIQLGSAECLLQLVSRKHGNRDEMTPALELFNAEAMTALVTAAGAAAGNSLDENRYAFLKVMCNILSALGQTLCILWGPTGHVQSEPQSFDLFIKALSGFFEHPSVTLRYHAAAALASFCKHEHIKKSPSFISMLPHLVEQIRTNTRKVGLPSKNGSAHFSLDFEEDAEFHVVWNKYREQVMTFLHRSISIDYSIAYNVGCNWLRDVLSRVSSDGRLDEAVGEPELESLNRYLSVLFTTMSKMDIFSSPNPCSEGREMLLEVLRKLQSMKAPNLMSQLLSTASSLFPFLSSNADLVPPIARALFACAVFTQAGDDVVADQCKDLRHHSMHEFVRLCVEFADHMLPHTDDLLPEIMQWNQLLSPRQKVCLAEGLSALSNKFQDFDRQGAFLADLLNDCAQYWTSASLSEALSNVDHFMYFIGLSCPAPAVWADEESAVFLRRRELLNACFLLCGVLNRTTVPSDQQVRERGRFLIDCGGRFVTRHPAFDTFQPLLLNVFALARCLNGLYSSAGLAKIHQSFGGVKAVDSPDVEKFAVHATASSYALIGRSETDKMFPKSSSADHMKVYLSNLAEQIQLLVGLFASKFQWQFFALPQTSSFLLNGCLGFIEDTMDLRLRFWIRRAFFPIVDCIHELGKEQFPVAMSAFSYLISIIYNRLQSRWDLVTRRQEAVTESGDLTGQEVYFEEVTTLLTRDAILLLHRALLAGHTVGSSAQDVAFNSDSAIDDVPESGEMDNEDVVMENGASHGTPSSRSQAGGGADALTELGACLCDPENGCIVPLTLMIFHCLAWPDTKAAVKAIQLCEKVAGKLTGSVLLDGQTAAHLFSHVLGSIQLHGEHDNALTPLLGLASAIYQRWYEAHPAVRQVMLLIPNCSSEALEAYEAKLSASKPPRALSEKARKDGFKKLVKSIIGTNTGKLFRRDQQLRDLPSMWRPPRAKSSAVTEDLGLCNLFGPAKP